MRIQVVSLDKAGQSAQQSDNSVLHADLHAPVNAFRLRSDLAVCFWESAARERQRFEMSFDRPVLRFSFILEGNGISRARGQEDFVRNKGIIEVRYFPGTGGIVELAPNQGHKWLDIVLQPSFLDIALPEETALLPHAVQSVVNRETDTLPCDSRRMTPEQFVAASQLAHCPYTHAARTLYLKSKTLELLSHVLAEYAPAPCRTRLSTYEIECLNKARDLLVADLEAPPSLKELALSVGLNETKLKTGFKAQFGQTVYGYFRAYRVDLARKRLLESTDSVSEVASSVGYTNISHFSAAFKERHGVTPSRYRKNNIFFTSPANG
ncbi:helix-turn-helix transcriptional regulator [Salidesulfovibrio onnuriiensis]|uniref:helix-turn-helix transcriptional regulator n=1 Tax=Salidesulfovibrio onnuriiensis TaxID=2583823 RepID=UPI00164FA025|nr:AraC family transcriptional regulator [Salidesulfovibrio onnuriiensis]